MIPQNTSPTADNLTSPIPYSASVYLHPPTPTSSLNPPLSSPPSFPLSLSTLFLPPSFLSHTSTLLMRRKHQLRSLMLNLSLKDSRVGCIYKHRHPGIINYDNYISCDDILPKIAENAEILSFQLRCFVSTSELKAF